MINYETEKIMNKIDKNFIEVLTRIYDVSLEGRNICEQILNLIDKDANVSRVKEDLDCFKQIIDALKNHNSIKSLKSKNDFSRWPILQIKKTG